MWRPFVVTGPSGDPAMVVRLRPEPNWEWELEADGRKLGAGPDRWFLAAELRYWVVRQAVESSSALLVHASTLARDGRALVAMAPSGGGKTTLALALAEAGWAYLGDDLAALDPASLEVSALPTPAGIRDPARWDELSSHWGEAAPWPPGASFLLPAAGLAPASSKPVPAGALAVLDYESGAEPRLERVTPGEAVVSCAAHVAARKPETVATLAMVCRRTPCVRLRYGSSADAVALLDGFWGAEVTQRSEPDA